MTMDPRIIKAIKELVRARDNDTCTECGMTRKEHRKKWNCGLCVHLIALDGPYTVEGCKLLCKACLGPKPKRPGLRISKRRTPAPKPMPSGVTVSGPRPSSSSMQFFASYVV